MLAVAVTAVAVITFVKLAVAVTRSSSNNFYVKLGMMHTQKNVKITAAYMNYKVSRKLLFKCHKRFRGDRESLKDDSHSGRLR